MARKKKLQIDNSNKSESPIDWDNAPFMRNSYYKSEIEIRELCEQILIAIETNEELISLEEILSKKRIDEVTYYRWVKKYPSVNQAHQFFLRALGVKREKYGAFGKCPVNSMFPFLHQYLDRYKQHDEYAASLKKDSNADANKVIHLHYSKLTDPENNET